MKIAFNWSELHLSKMTSYKIHILDPKLYRNAFDLGFETKTFVTDNIEKTCALKLF